MRGLAREPRTNDHPRSAGQTRWERCVEGGLIARTGLVVGTILAVPAIIALAPEVPVGMTIVSNVVADLSLYGVARVGALVTFPGAAACASAADRQYRAMSGAPNRERLTIAVMACASP